MNTNVKVIGLTRLGIKPESTAQETDAPYHSNYDINYDIQKFNCDAESPHKRWPKAHINWTCVQANYYLKMYHRPFGGPGIC